MCEFVGEFLQDGGLYGNHTGLHFGANRGQCSGSNTPDEMTAKVDGFARCDETSDILQ
jgi:hypothetical protein